MNTDWIAEGKQVAEYDLGRGRHGDATITKVAKLTGTQVICDSGNVYRRDTLYAVGAGRGFLLPLTDARVIGVRARRRLQSLHGELDDLFHQPAEDLDEVLAVLSRVNEAVHQARDEIDAYSA
jgi:hypothetical protein